MRSGSALTLLSLLAAGAASGCVAVPGGPGYPRPLAAYPGTGKSSAGFSQDDTACRASAAAQPTPAPTLAPTLALAPAVSPATPASVYFDCMTSRGNLVGPAPNTVMVGTLYPVYPYGYAYAGYPYGGAYPGVLADEFFLNRGVGYRPYGGYWRGGFRR